MRLDDPCYEFKLPNVQIISGHPEYFLVFRIILLDIQRVLSRSLVEMQYFVSSYTAALSAHTLERSPGLPYYVLQRCDIRPLI